MEKKDREKKLMITITPATTTEVKERITISSVVCPEKRLHFRAKKSNQATYCCRLNPGPGPGPGGPSQIEQ